MTDITKKQITDYMKTVDTGTTNGQVVMNQLKKAISMNESSDTPFSDSINSKLLNFITRQSLQQQQQEKRNQDAFENERKQKKRTGGKVYSNMQSRKVRV